MYLFFDESGDFAFPTNRFDCYVQAGLIAPEGVLARLDEIVSARLDAWGLEELHAKDLDRSTQLFEVARAIARSDVRPVAHVTDTDLVTIKDIRKYRSEQAKRLRASVARYRRQTKAIGRQPHESIPDFVYPVAKRVDLSTRISDSEFVQAQFFVHLIAEGFQRALVLYYEDQWRDAFHDFHFILDGKLPGKLAAGEKYLRDVIRPYLGSQPGTSIITIDKWRGADPPHPFVEKFHVDEGRIAGETVQGAIDLNGVFEHGLQFEPSHEHPGLQLVDTVAFVVRQAVLEPEDRAIQRAFDVLRPRLGFGRHTLTVYRLNVGPARPGSRFRYSPLQGPTRIGNFHLRS